MNTPVEPSRSFHNEGQQINAERVDTVIYVSRSVRERVEAQALPPEQVEHLRQVYVRNPASESAIRALNERHAVVLVGPPGYGRRITGVYAITELHATPHPIYLDPGDTRRDLPANPGCGYLVDIDEQTVRDMPALKDLIASYREQLAAADAYLVVTSTSAAWSALGPQTGMEAVFVRPPSSVAVFSSHLDHLRDDEAGRWTSHQEVLLVLNDAEPSDAVRLAELANASLAFASGEDAIQQALAAYRNWTAQLAEWFKNNDEGYPRALLIAAAALNEAEAATVFEAADRLSQTVKLPRPPGGGLVGDGVTRLLEQIGADLTDDGRIRFLRPAYPESILDHVWDDRPHLHADLRRWLVELPGSLRDASAAYAGHALRDLAVRQADPTLITNAVAVWAEQSACRELAVTVLTEAGVSDSIGRTVRRTMYGWAASARTPQSLQLTVADVCGGPFGKSFPRNAMTRLRHLALNGGATVHDRVAIALRTLAGEPVLRDFMLREIVSWASDASQVRVPGVRAFLALGTECAADLMPRTLSDSTRIEVLAAGLRAALRDSGHVVQAREVCCEWLEAAAQGNIAAVVVTDVIAHTCRDSYDIGLLAPVIWRWGQASDQQTVVPRDEIVAQLLQKAADRDPLAPGVSATSVYTATSAVSGNVRPGHDPA